MDAQSARRDGNGDEVKSRLQIIDRDKSYKWETLRRLFIGDGHSLTNAPGFEKGY